MRAEDAAGSHLLGVKDRFGLFGPRELSDAELLALAIGKPDASAKMAQALESIGGISRLEHMTQKELASIPGIGSATAMRLRAAMELYQRCYRLDQVWIRTIRTPSDAADVIRNHLRGMTQECFLILGLDARQRIRLVRTVGIGSIAQVDVHPREIFRPLIREGVHSVIIAHNHPSGDAEPSAADVELTKRVWDVGKLVGIPVLDHLIVSDHDHVSLAALGLVPQE